MFGIRLLAILSGAIGGAVAIGSMEMFSAATAFPLAAIPFATSIVMVLATPDAAPAQPRALIGGHLVATLVGLAVVKLCGPAPWAAAVAVGLAMIAMHLEVFVEFMGFDGGIDANDVNLELVDESFQGIRKLASLRPGRSRRRLGQRQLDPSDIWLSFFHRPLLQEISWDQTKLCLSSSKRLPLRFLLMRLLNPSSFSICRLRRSLSGL
jgi:hypothetical protein